MIFVTLGTQHFPMNRIIDEIDRLIDLGNIQPNEVIIQNGTSKKSKYAKSYEMMDENLFNNCLNKCDILITHGGTSSIIKGLKENKKVIVVPRRKIYKEHVDDHQIQITNLFKEKNYVLVINEMSELREALRNIQNIKFSKFESKAELVNYIIKKYLYN